MGNPVLLVAGRDPAREPSGGHSAYVVAHALAARRAGYEPHLLAVGPSRRVRTQDPAPVHLVPSRGFPVRQLYALRLVPRLAAATLALARSFPPPHRLHGFSIWGAAAVLAARRLRAEGREAVAYVGAYTTYEEEKRSHVLGACEGYGWGVRARFAAEVLWIRAAVNRWERLAYEGADVVLWNYASVRRLLEERYDLGGRGRALPYAPPLSFAALAAPGAAPVRRTGPALVLCVARHEPRKGQDVLLAALAILRARGVPFTARLVGGGPLLAVNRERARALGLGATVVLPGVVPDVLPELCRADVFVLPSRREHSASLALLEAMAAGRPVVASACDGMLEDLTDGVDGLLVPPGDATALADAVARLLEDPDLCERLGAAARQTCAGRFGPERFARALAELYAAPVEAEVG